jgi:hypothetical protein
MERFPECGFSDKVTGESSGQYFVSVGFEGFRKVNKPERIGKGKLRPGTSTESGDTPPYVGMDRN